MATEEDLANLLLASAHEDEAAARAVASIADIADRVVGFHAQQAVEKSLKAVLASSGEGFPFTHDIAALTEHCAGRGVTIPSALEGIERLTQFAAAVRYGAVSDQGADRDELVRWAGAAVEWATTQLAAGT